MLGTYKGLEHPWILVSMGFRVVLEPIPHGNTQETADGVGALIRCRVRTLEASLLRL